MPKAFDTYVPAAVIANAAALVSSGITAVGLYYFRPGTSRFKVNLSRDAAVKISAAGLYIISVYESGMPTSADYFTVATAQADAHTAAALAASAGQPDGTPIYFAVDYDASPDDLDAIADYFTEARSVLAALGGGDMLYGVGVYGSGLVCRFLSEKGLVSHTWLSGSRGWSGYADWHDLASIVQSNPETLLGMDTDPDVTNGNAGGWKSQADQ